QTSELENTNGQTTRLARAGGHTRSGAGTLSPSVLLPDKNAAATQPHNAAGNEPRAIRALHHKPSVYLPVRSADDGQRGLHLREGPVLRRHYGRLAYPELGSGPPAQPKSH